MQLHVTPYYRINNDGNEFRRPYYDPAIGECRSYLISNCKHTVKIRSLNQIVHFKAWEPIHTEISTKFDIETIYDLAQTTGFTIEANYFDENKWFVDSVWKVE